jgi:sulfide:quinone oxidoreductase
MVASRLHHVVVVGGGSAATEVVLVLREHGAPVRVTVVAPEPEMDLAALPVAGAFAAPAGRQDLTTIAKDVGAELVQGRAVAVDAHRHRVHIDGGRALAYDVLVVAVGASPRPTIDRALTLHGEAGRTAVDRVLAERAPVIDFINPPGMTRALSLYELAIHAGDEVRARGLDVALRLVTPERAPLSRFGEQTTLAVGRLLDAAGVAFEGGASVFEGLDGLLRVNDAATILPGGRTVALPVLDGPALPGVPSTPGGFIPVDAHGAVPGVPDVYAVGDATACALKHVDVVAAQAATVADAIAARAGVSVAPTPWTATAREHLLLDHGLGDLTLAHDCTTEARAILRVIADDGPRPAAPQQQL